MLDEIRRLNFPIRRIRLLRVDLMSELRELDRLLLPNSGIWKIRSTHIPHIPLDSEI